MQNRYLPTYLVYIPIYPYTCIPVYLSTCLPVYLSTCLPVYLSTFFLCSYVPTCLHIPTYMYAYMLCPLPIFLAITYPHNLAMSHCSVHRLRMMPM
ncbi:hypothetical protein F5Y11DRAFT_232777 [Daldinia sp. FL1419]|nr:hypothetical protein F5Y11DRAFT_232777 [Daldinia sp. FL1419]